MSRNTSPFVKLFDARFSYIRPSFFYFTRNAEIHSKF